MVFIEKNVNLSITVSLGALRLFGFWAPEGLTPKQRFLYNCYGFFSFIFLLGTYLFIQVVDMFMIWGDLPLMTGTAFVLFTNLAQASKLASVLVRARTLRGVVADADRLLAAQKGPAADIVRSCDRQTRVQQLLYFCLTTVTVAGWAGSAETNQLPLRACCDRQTRVQQRLYFCLTTVAGWAGSAETNQLPLRAWYPYDTSRSPAYELTYVHQVGALFAAAYLNVGKDTLVTALIAQVRCRLQLLALRLRTLCDRLAPNQQGLLTAEQEAVVWARLRTAARQHQQALAAAARLQDCFSAPIFAQFSVSMVIICVTAFQMAAQTGNLVRLLSMGTYLLNMTFQVFLYCYQGNELSEESVEIAGAAYESGWEQCGPRLRRALLLVMVRTRRAARLSAGGFTTLSLASFMAIVKTSYSLFTVLQQADEQK